MYTGKKKKKNFDKSVMGRWWVSMRTCHDLSKCRDTWRHIKKI